MATSGPSGVRRGKPYVRYCTAVYIPSPRLGGSAPRAAGWSGTSFRILTLNLGCGPAWLAGGVWRAVEDRRCAAAQSRCLVMCNPLYVWIRASFNGARRPTSLVCQVVFFFYLRGMRPCQWGPLYSKDVVEPCPQNIPTHGRRVPTPAARHSMPLSCMYSCGCAM